MEQILSPHQKNILYYVKNFVIDTTFEVLSLDWLGPCIITGEAQLAIVDTALKTLPEVHPEIVRIKITNPDHAENMPAGFYLQKEVSDIMYLEYLADKNPQRQL